MAIIQHTLTSTGIPVGTSVRFNADYYLNKGIRVPKVRPTLILTGIISSNAAGERAEIMYSKGKESGYLWAKPFDLEPVDA